MMHYIFEESLEGLIEPSAKEIERFPIDDEWRGWNYHNDNLRPQFNDVRLPIYAIAARYCKSGRDCYLRFVKKLKPVPTEGMIEGVMYHAVLSEIVEYARRYIYSKAIDEKFNIAGFLHFRGLEVIEKLLKSDDVKKGLKAGVVKQSDLDQAKKNLEKLWNYEATLIAAAVEFQMAKHLHVNRDTLARHGVPIFVEQKLDGRKLGLSSNLSVDALYLPGRIIVVDVKTGHKQEFHRLTTAGYALVIESIERRPVDVGVIIHPSFPKDRSVPNVEVDVHPITDKLRKEFVDERNKKLEIVAEKVDPLHEDGGEWCDGCKIFKK